MPQNSLCALYSSSKPLAIFHSSSNGVGFQHPFFRWLLTDIRLSSQGTEIYDAKKGSFVDVGILDVMQIFGRAGRPQFDTEGHGYIITKHEKLSHYLTVLTRQTPIESQFVQSLTDNLNAEVWLCFLRICIQRWENNLFFVN